MKGNEKSEHKSRYPAAQFFAFLALIVLAYILSVGPVLSVAARVHCYGTPFYRFLRGFYAPVFALAKSSDTATSLYESYARMWCRIVLPPGLAGT